MLYPEKSKPWLKAVLQNKMVRVLLFFPRIFFLKIPDRVGRTFWNLIIKLLFFLPVGIQLLVLRNDQITYYKGEMTNKELAIRGLWIGWIFFAIIAVLTVRCLFRSLRITQEWNNAHNLYMRLKNCNK